MSALRFSSCSSLFLQGKKQNISLNYWIIMEVLKLIIAINYAIKPIPVSLPGKSHGQRNLVDCSPWGRKESGMTERLTHRVEVTNRVKGLDLVDGVPE